jgi:exonuclease VII small subunit
MPPTDILNHLDYNKLRDDVKADLKQKFDDQIAHLQGVIKALQDGRAKLDQK